jgi:hypothetical protein
MVTPVGMVGPCEIIKTSTMTVKLKARMVTDFQVRCFEVKIELRKKMGSVFYADFILFCRRRTRAKPPRSRLSRA